MASIKIALDPKQRTKYFNKLLKNDGLQGIKEVKNAAYCAISLTTTPDELKPYLSQQQQLIMTALQSASITPYDPYSAPFSPDAGLTITPDEIYRYDKGRVVGARFFIAHDVLPSTGVGVETETARIYNKIAVVIHNKNIRTSRMQPNRTIHLMYENLQAQLEDFIAVFRFLKDFQQGFGFENGEPVLLGFDKQGIAINLEKAIYNKFPHLKYIYDGTISNAKLNCHNKDIFS